MKTLFRGKKLLAIISISMALIVSVISLFQYPSTMRVEAGDMVKDSVIENSLYAPGDEMVSQRTENSKKYYLGNNSYALDISMAAIHYKDNYSDKQELFR